MRPLMIVFAPYFVAGVFSGAYIHNTSHVDPRVFGILFPLYLTMGAFAYFLATHSTTKEGAPRFGLKVALSPGGWGFGFGLAFIAGVLTAIYCK